MLDQARTAAHLLRIGEGVLFVALVLIGLGRAAWAGQPWPVFAAGAAVLGVFAVGVLLARRLGDAERTGWVLLLLGGTLGLILLSGDLLWVLFPVWLIAGRLLALPLALILTAISLAVAITVLNSEASTQSFGVLGPLVGALVALGLARGVVRFEREAAERERLLGEVLRAQEEADALSDEVVRAQREAGVLAERTRLAHDIHDTLAQGLASIVLLARAARREPDADGVRALVAQIEGMAAENLAEARRVVYALAPDEVAKGGLAAPLRRLTEEAAEQLGAAASVTIDDDLPRLGTATEVALLRAAQGALANVRRHSRAGLIAITLARAGDDVRLDVVDDGVGFDPLALPDAPTLAGGYGLRALRERLDALGGGLDLESEPGGGTAVSVRLPLTTAAGGLR